MIVPGRMTLLCAAVLALALIAAIIEPVVTPAVLAADALLLAVCWLQGRKLQKLPVEVNREPWGRVQVGRSEEIQLPADQSIHVGGDRAPAPALAGWNYAAMRILSKSGWRPARSCAPRLLPHPRYGASSKCLPCSWISGLQSTGHAADGAPAAEK